ncbi:MAG: YgiT-type zinc finger protein [Candidatus Schekmanbacteria bacterium]|nr:YgiT-type zinc finger protein [Candidatus Schekmanbacteria bacterium]
MKCVICHGEQVEIIQVNEEINLGNDIVYIPVKISVCKTCGERYYDRQTMQFLEDIEKKLHAEQGKLKEVGKVLVYG